MKYTYFNKVVQVGDLVKTMPWTKYPDRLGVILKIKQFPGLAGQEILDLVVLVGDKRLNFLCADIVKI